jgi:diguanylate cyclase (GGDEF)-like protein
MSNDSDSVDSVDAKLFRLRERFIGTLPKRIDELASAIDECANEETLRRFHSLAGTAGTYGLTAISALAREGEDICNEGESLNDAETLIYLRSLIEMMRATAVEPGDETAPVEQKAREDEGRVLCVENDLDQARYITTILENSGYLTKPVNPQLLRSIVAARLRGSRAGQGLIDHDGLTGVLTHAAFMRRAEIELSQARRNGAKIALVMLELDYFKSVNDTHGHLAGDQVLAAFATFITTAIRAADDVGRHGGEEFALLLRDINVDNVQRLITRLLDDFSRFTFRGARGATFNVTFSAGVAMLERGWDLREWKQRADDALYNAKHHGRARVEAA